MKKYRIRQTYILEMEVEAKNEEEASEIVAEIPWCDICNYLVDEFPDPEIQEVK